MTRAPIKLSDDEARVLARELLAIEAAHPLDARDHRPFVRAFIRAVHQATGRTFSPAVYRRWLGAYAPDRRPSNSTLALEKQAFADELDRSAGAAFELAAGASPNLAALVRAAVADAMGARSTPQSMPGAGAGGGDAIFWRERAAEADNALADARALAARLAGELQAARAVTDQMSAELATSRAALAGYTAELAKMAEAIESSRLFFMRAIDEARGETRNWRDRCAAVETNAALQAKQDAMLLETFRQIAYQRGAPIPAALRKDGQ